MYIERTIFKTLRNHLNNGKITILIGSRQVGKTTLLKELCKELKPENYCLFMDLDIYSNYESVSTYENLIATLRLNGYKKNQKTLFVLFLDEFQRYADVSMVMKNVADHHPNIKIYASGSSSLAINAKIQESLAGRKRIVRIHPLSFREFLRFQNREELIEKMDRISDTRSVVLNKLAPELFRCFESFLIYGGYPEAALAGPGERKEVYRGIFDLYVKKDLVDYLKVEKIKNAKLLIQTLAVNNGCETKFNELGQVASLDFKSVKNFIEILKETFLISVHTPWFTNKNKEIVKMPKVYFLDNGVCNYFVNNFNDIAIRPDAAYLFEGYVISELIKMGVSPEAIKFWRTKNQIEVDLILESGGRTIPVEIKHKQKISTSDLGGLRSYKNQYPATKTTYLVNLNNNETLAGTRLLSPFDLDILVS
jgi:uncharacterized protein